MKRIEKAYEEYPNGIVYGEGFSNPCTLEDLGCCPHFIGLGEDNLDDNSEVNDVSGNVIGCRGITCIECWNKEYTEED